jgi:hypothetical protein
VLLLIIPGQGTPPQGIDFRQVLIDLYPRLNASSAATLIYWTDAEFYEWSDEAAKRLARNLGVFVERDASTTIVTSTAVYGLPARHVSTIHASIAGVALYPNNVQEVEALDSTWIETEGATNSFLNDNQGTTTIRVYPAPDGTISGALAVIFHRYPVTISDSAYQLVVPDCLAEYFAWRLLSEAHRKESPGRKPEVGEHFAKRVELMDKIIESYWGVAQ